MLVRVHICGVRGSTPAPGTEFAGVGGHTSCVAVAHDDEDGHGSCSTPARGCAASPALLGGRPFRGTILLGHLHWDHTQGLPFFRAGDRADAARGCCCPPRAATRWSCSSGSCRRRRSPSGRRAPRRLVLRALDEGVHEIEGFTVLAREIPHKGGRTFGYRVSDGHGAARLPVRPRPLARSARAPTAWAPYHEAALELAAGVDLLIHDAQHTAAELPARADFGHSAADVRRSGSPPRAGRPPGAAVPPRPRPHRRRGRRHRRSRSAGAKALASKPRAKGAVFVLGSPS